MGFRLLGEVPAGAIVIIIIIIIIIINLRVVLKKVKIHKACWNGKWSRIRAGQWTTYFERIS